MTHDSSQERKETVPELTNYKIPSYIPIQSPIYKLLLNSHSNSFEFLEELGKGGFGSVHKVKHILDQQFYAIKRIKIHLGKMADIR